MIKMVSIFVFLFCINIFSQENCFNKEEIKKFRKEVIKEYKESDKSPLLDKDKKKHNPLKFYEPNESFSVSAEFIEKEKKDTVLMKTSKNDVRTMLRFGVLYFQISGVKFKLSAFIRADEKNPKSLFIPFTDETSNNGKSYSSGRYLDLEYKKNQKSYCLDFNYSYNPYCAYNNKYSCPLVPLENNLEIEILAGEKNYNKK